MKMKFTLMGLGMLLLFSAVKVFAQAPFTPPGTYTTSWLGNTYSDNNNKAVVNMNCSCR